jgi:hypothetical protein
MNPEQNIRMAGESTTYLCKKCRCKLLWDGQFYRCISCDFRTSPKSAAASSKSPKRPDPRK